MCVYRQIYGAVALSKKCAPRDFLTDTPSPETVVFEVCQTYITEENPYGVGDCLGMLAHPYGKRWGVHWFDGGREPLEKKFLRKAVQLHERVKINGKLCECLLVDEEGAHMSEVLPADAEARKKAVAEAKKEAAALKKKAAVEATKKDATDKKITAAEAKKKAAAEKKKAAAEAKKNPASESQKNAAAEAKNKAASEPKNKAAADAGAGKKATDAGVEASADAGAEKDVDVQCVLFVRATSPPHHHTPIHHALHSAHLTHTQNNPDKDKKQVARSTINAIAEQEVQQRC